MTTNQEPLFNRELLVQEQAAAEQNLGQHLDNVCSWSDDRMATTHDLEHELREVRYWAQNLHTVRRLIEGSAG